jgi:cytochrome c oxidase cbb3-type subunit III
VSSFCQRSCRGLILLALIAAGCDFPGRPDPADRPVPADQVKNFDILYATRCAGCHGVDGKKGPAPPLNDPLFLAIVPDAELLRVIKNGRSVSPTQKTPMPAFCLSTVGRASDAPDKAGTTVDDAHGDPKQQGPLTAEQAEILAHGIKQRWKAASATRDSVPPYLASKTADGGNKENGAKVFARACAGCHGENGDAEGATINDPAFLSLISDQALRRYVITGRPDLKMPPFDGTDGRSDDFRPLNSVEINDLVALLADWRRGAGTKSN